MPSSHTAERRYEPVYRDDLDAGRPRRPPPQQARTHRPRYYYDDEPAPRDRRPRRRRPERDLKSNSSSSDSGSPPPLRRHHRREPQPRNYDAYDSYEDYPPRRRQDPSRRNEGYYTDNRHNRPRNDPYEGRRRKDKDHEHHDRGSPKDRPAPERKQSRWQKEAKDMFKEYAVPVIKAEGGKYISKQIGNLIAKQAV